MDSLVPVPKLLHIRLPIASKVPEIAVAGVKLLQMGVREVSYPLSRKDSIEPAPAQSVRSPPVPRKRGQNPFQPASSSPSPRTSLRQARKSLMRYTAVKEISEGDYLPLSARAALTPVREMNESQASDCPMTMEELASSGPGRIPGGGGGVGGTVCKETSSLQRGIIDVTQSMPELLPWEQRYKVVAELLDDYSGKIDSLQALLSAKDKEIAAIQSKLMYETKEKETLAALRKIAELDRQLKSMNIEAGNSQKAIIRPPGEPFLGGSLSPRGYFGRRQVGFRFKSPNNEEIGGWGAGGRSKGGEKAGNQP